MTLKTFNGLASASVKTINGLAKASVKNFNGLAFPSAANIAYVNSAFDYAYNTTSKTMSFTVSTGDNRILLANIVTTSAISGTPTYAGSNMTQINSEVSGGVYSYLYYIVAPATGANNIVVGIGSTGGIGIICAEYTGVAQTSPIDASDTLAAAVGTSFSKSLTTTTDNCLVILAGEANSAFSLTMTSGTKRTQDGSFIGNYFTDIGPKTPAGSATISFTCSSQNVFGNIAAIKPA